MWSVGNSKKLFFTPQNSATKPTGWQRRFLKNVTYREGVVMRSSVRKIENLFGVKN